MGKIQPLSQITCIKAPGKVNQCFQFSWKHYLVLYRDKTQTKMTASRFYKQERLSRAEVNF